MVEDHYGNVVGVFFGDHCGLVDCFACDMVIGGVCCEGWAP